MKKKNLKRAAALAAGILTIACGAALATITLTEGTFDGRTVLGLLLLPAGTAAIICGKSTTH